MEHPRGHEVHRGPQYAQHARGHPLTQRKVDRMSVPRQQDLRFPGRNPIFRIK